MVTHFVAIKRDVTEEQRTQDELAHAHEELAARVTEIEALNRLLHEDKNRMDAEFRLGRQIQRRLLPEPPGDWHDVDLAVSSVPCFELGGDYHDFIDLPDGDLGLAIGDVSGKGMGAALIMSSAQAALRVAAPTEPDLARLIARLDALLFRTTLKAKFATFFFARYSRSGGVLHYVNAGHNPPLVSSRGTIMRLEATGPPLGIMGGSSFREASCPFEVGSTLYLYSDGFNEAENPDGEEFGLNRWEALVGESAHLSVSESSRFLTEAIARFEGGAGPRTTRRSSSSGGPNEAGRRAGGGTPPAGTVDPPPCRLAARFGAALAAALVRAAVAVTRAEESARVAVRIILPAVDSQPRNRPRGRV